MKSKILIAGSIFLVFAVIAILLWPMLSAFASVFFGISSVNRLESMMCSQEYYDPVGKDLALICSNIKPDTEISDVGNIWWPDSIRTLGPIRGYLSSDGAGVLFTCGFTHLSYKLEKIFVDGSNSEKWALTFEDEGRSKYLTTVELSEKEYFNFDNMFQEATKEYELRVKENPDLIQLKQQKVKLLSLFDKTENSQPTE